MRMSIPPGKVINDNGDVHYRAHQGKIAYLSTTAESYLLGGSPFKGFPTQGNPEALAEMVRSLGSPIGIIQETWRFGNRRFDPQNLSKTFKGPLDILVSNGVLPDDNFKNIKFVKIVGGSLEYLSKSGDERRRADCLNSELLIPYSLDEWLEEYGDVQSTLIRIIATNES